MKTKKCTKCDIEKPLSGFGNSKSTKDGKTYWCKQCKREYQKTHQFDSSYIYSQIKARVKFCRKNNKGYRSGGKRRMSISRKDFCNWYETQPRFCIYCGISEGDLHKHGDLYNDKIERLTVDCADNALSYVKDNLVLSCGRCNSIKSDFLSYDEMLYVGKNIVSKRWK